MFTAAVPLYRVVRGTTIESSGARPAARWDRQAGPGHGTRAVPPPAAPACWVHGTMVLLNAAQNQGGKLITTQPQCTEERVLVGRMQYLAVLLENAELGQ